MIRDWRSKMNKVGKPKEIRINGKLEVSARDLLIMAGMASPKELNSQSTAEVIGKYCVLRLRYGADPLVFYLNQVNGEAHELHVRVGDELKAQGLILKDPTPAKLLLLWEKAWEIPKELLPELRPYFDHIVETVDPHLHLHIKDVGSKWKCYGKNPTILASSDSRMVGEVVEDYSRIPLKRPGYLVIQENKQPSREMRMWMNLKYRGASAQLINAPDWEDKRSWTDIVVVV